MIKPDLKEEKKLWKKGYKLVVGLDEVGRGPLAGPVVAAAVAIQNCKLEIRTSPKARTLNASSIRTSPKARTLNASHILENFGNIRDSKKLTPRQREKFYDILTSHPEIEWGIGKVSEKVIDKINILEATKLAMQKAIEDLDCTPDYLILDGNIKINSDLPQKAIIKADEKVFSVASASIIAKVTRDRLMMRLHKKYPQYNFEKHKGYGTVRHCQMLKKHGPCKIHRQSFGPVRSNLVRF